MVGKGVFAVLSLVVSVLGAALPGITPPAALDHELSQSTTATQNSLSCVHAWCQNDKSICAYWGGITGWDELHGPRPGMINTILGPCTQGVAVPQPDADEDPVYGNQGLDDHEKDYSTTVAASVSSLADGAEVYASTTAEQAVETAEAATRSIECMKTYCNEYGSLMCHYWADVTAWDVDMGIIPGMTVTNMGSCPTPTPTQTEY